MPVKVIVVRHGERLDEADRQKWRSIRTEETQHDPPLTDAGWDQATLAGQKIDALLNARDFRVTMYSSPTARTLTTAAAILTRLSDNCKPTSVTPAYSLNCCAAAKTYGVHKSFPKNQPAGDVLKGAALACWPPLGDPDLVDQRQERHGGFVESVKELAAKHADGDVLILVTHREGIWELLHCIGGQMKSGYCAITLCSYELSSQLLARWDGVFEPNDSNVSPRTFCELEGNAIVNKLQEIRSLAKLDVVRIECVAADGLEAMLASGSGSVIIHRKGRGGGSGTLLWRTPGVRGVWAEGGAVTDGEIVTLLSCPVTSEGKEGDFVLIRTSSGREGWTKVRNIHLPDRTHKQFSH
eukprot:TRINITY_DN48708_c0_g1_i1.p1 TRINITY_DN48708_c0_g1~~TRINITY_DN48708_c0_g1_i1.p1  ORF type:complete len:354 (+),score=45.22 TRINITY_DN48708_c0_g1_i1:58-1119(+)